MNINNKSKLSIIIPTMQKNTIILTKLIDELVENDLVGEVIVIDNSLKGYSHSSEKVKIVVPESNLYVNGSWNYGIKISKYEYFGILNDDLLLPKNLIGEVIDFVQHNDIGIVGINNKSIYGEEENETYSYPADSPIKFDVFDDDSKGLGYWGVAFWGHKSSYYEIPEEMKVWYGDNYLFKMNKDNNKQNYKVCCKEIKHIGSLTASNPLLNEIKQKDADFYAQIDNRFIGTDVTKQSKKTLLKFLFSIKNARNKRSKIVTILGVQFEVKRRGI